MCKNDEQLCWNCRRATGGCPWSTMGRPIDGWTAEKTKIPNGCADEFTESYKITACPLFVKDDERVPVVMLGERISLDFLGKLTGEKGQRLKEFSDEKLINFAAQRGIMLDVSYAKNRIVRVMGVKKWSGVKTV